MPAKIAAKYGLWWGKAAELGRKIAELGGELVDGIKGLIGAKKKLEALPDPRPAQSTMRLPDCHSFVPGTRVVMADGSTKPIEEVETGGEVLATDPETGEQSARTVLATIIGSGSKVLVQITIDPTTERDVPGDETFSEDAVDTESAGIPGPVAAGDVVIATDEHPFWVPELKAWVDAIDLAPGMWLQTSAGTWVQINAIQAWSQPATVHNLTVQGVHTYHVSTGSLDVLNHNCGDAGYADVFLDMEQGHASIAVTHNGRTIHTEAGSRVGEDSIVGLRRASHSSGTDVVRVPLSNARRAQQAQNYFLDDNNLGPHNNNTNNCVTFCARILKAGGCEMPVSRSSEIASWLLETSFERRRL